MSTATTTSTRRDGRTAGTVPDDRVREMILAVFADHAAAGMCRPTQRELRGRIKGVDTARTWRLMRELVESGAVPDLPVGRRARANRLSPISAADLVDHAARLEQVRTEKERASRGRGRGRGRGRAAGRTVRELIRAVRAAERNIGIRG